VKTALVIVDVQNDFIPGGALAVPQGDAVVPVINRLQSLKGRLFDLIIATQDWHPPDHGSFAANHPGTHVGDVIDLNGLRQILWPVHCVQHTTGADFVPLLDRSRIDHVIRKGTDPAIDSYSGFFDNGHRKATGLHEYLQSHSIDELDICGLATDYCVKFTALDAKQLGFTAHLIEDACRGVELHSGDVADAVEEMRRAGVEVMRSSDAIELGERRTDGAR
jgi:nicotinamidase/pyrazinamidase